MKNFVKLVIFILIVMILIPIGYYFLYSLEPKEQKNEVEQTDNKIQYYSYKIINTYPHDPKASTQGLVFEDGYFYESTGYYDSSSLRKVEIATGKVLQIYNLSSKYYGEGMTIFNDSIIQLTWKSGTGFVYDKNTFEQKQLFNYSTEGWGLTHDGKNLIMSDGTSTLYYLDPETFDVFNQINVIDNNSAVNNLNELEYINGDIYANVWKTNKIAIINTQNGNVTGWINLEGLIEQNYQTQNIGVLNGIAFDSKNERLFVTGKLWSNIFEIELIKL